MKKDIYVLAHEIKNPLCVVKGYLEMLNKDNLDQYKDIITNEINSSIEILDNYLEYDKLSLNMEEIDINLFLSEIKKSMQDYLKMQGVKLKLSLEDDEIYINADYNKLKQVFYNIIKNSVEAGSKNILIKYEVLNNEIKIVIENDGQKINNLHKIGKNYSDKVLGNGIGIKLSKKIIKMHQGKIKYYNNQDGVSCDIILPL